ncbi:MAG TPA: hypothetical protein VE650_06450 [Acetobacteraceae bacterium]|nr:hypothetical protein [Acetobacteraceae bacterium]
MREIKLPPEARGLTALSRVDYTDCFILETARVRDRTGEDWARALLEEAPPGTRDALRRGWRALGVRLGSTADDRLVLGWLVRSSSPDFALLAARSVFGMDAEVLIKREPRGVLAATLIKFNHPLMRVFWAGFSFQHRRVLRHLLVQAGRRANAAGSGGGE